MDRPFIKVLVVIDSLLPGGAERSLLSMLPGLKKHGIDARLVCLKKAPVNLEADARTIGFNPTYLMENERKGKWYLSLPHWTWNLRKLIATEKPDLIHSTLFQANLTCRLATIGARVPHLTSIVNMDYSPERNSDPNIRGGRQVASFKIQALRLINRLTTGLVSHFHAVTPALKEETAVQLAVKREQITVVFRGRRPHREAAQKDKEALRSELGLGHKTKLVLNIGSQEHQKGQLYLIRAFNDESLRQQDVVLAIAGREGALSPQLKNEIRDSGLENRIKLLGHRDDIARLLSTADIFCLPSLFEGAAGALLEAMSAGLPIVVSDLPELQGIVDDDCAVKVPPKSPEALAKSISRLCNDASLTGRLGTAGKERFLKTFLLSQVIERMAKLYQRTASNRKLGGGSRRFRGTHSQVGLPL